MEITLNISDELATRLQPVQKALPEILEMGIREWNARGVTGFPGLMAILEKLASLPSPEEVLDLRPSPELQGRIEELLKKNSSGLLSTVERQEMEQYLYVEHLVRLAKARAALKIKGT